MSLDLTSNNVFLKSAQTQLTFSEFKEFTKHISSQLRDITKDTSKENNLVLIDIRNPFYLAAYVFAVLSLKLKPALINSYFKKDQVDAVLKNNSYSLFITDQPHCELKSLEIDSNLPFQFESGDLDIPLNSEIIFFTSGSVQSKACVLTLENFFFNAKGSTENIPFNSNDTWGLCLPLFHVGGFSILIRSILAKGSVALIDNDRNYTKQLEKLSVSHISFVSTQFIRYLEEDITYKPAFILLGGSSMPEAALKKSIDLKLPIYKSYGMTEMASQICTTNQLTHISEITQSGKLLPHREMKIEDNKIYVKGLCLFKGYINQNVLVKPFDSEGWFYTHDCGRFDNNEIHLTGRADRIFQSAGENLSPEIIEQELLKIPGVLRAYVCPEMDETYGLRPIAYVDKNENLDNESILSHLNKKLSGLYRPKAIRSWKDSPKSSWK